MTVKAVDKANQNQKQEQDLKVPSMDAADQEKKKKVFAAATEEDDQESGGSSAEEVESPKSVARVARKKVAGRRFMHSQIQRVKEEEMMFFAEDVSKSSLGKETAENDCHPKRRVNVVVFSRPMLPCSPLSGKTAASNVRTALH